MQMLLMSWAEGRRWMDITNPGSVNADPLFGASSGYVCTGSEVGYPGGKWFDPLGLTASKEKYEVLKLKEIKNGRLAMVRGRADGRVWQPDLGATGRRSLPRCCILVSLPRAHRCRRAC